MKSPLPPSQFWHSGQCFLIFVAADRWDSIIDATIGQFEVSPFDLIQTEQNSSLGVQEARAMIKEAQAGPAQGPIKLCVIKGIDAATDEAANALLKILEEVPEKTRFLLLAETRRVLPTIRSRCATWHAFTAEDQTEALLPLDSTTSFATVTTRVASAVQAGQAITVLDQWTYQVLQRPSPEPATLRWLIEARNALSQTAVNASALLEATYLSITHDVPLPSLSAFEVIHN